MCNVCVQLSLSTESLQPLRPLETGREPAACVPGGGGRAPLGLASPRPRLLVTESVQSPLKQGPQYLGRNLESC